MARALVRAGGLRELGTDALGAVGEALQLDVVAMYMPEPGGSPILRLFETWPNVAERGRVKDILALDPEAWHFLAASSGPLVFRQPETLIFDNPFVPASNSWVALPLLDHGAIEGAVFGSSSMAISLGALTRASLGSIADLLSSGAATARLRLESQRTQIQRERLALVAELHDGLAQDLALAVREVAFLETEPAADRARASTQRLAQAVRSAHRLVRAELEDLAQDVSEPGLETAVRTVARRFIERGLRVELPENFAALSVSPAIVAVLLRVLNEALTNVERHSQSDDATVTLRLDGETLVMCVKDHGVGIDSEHLSAAGEGHFGVSIMRARAMSVGGTVEINGLPGGGTEVVTSVPLRATDR